MSKAAKGKATLKDYQVLVAPIVTEKSALVGGGGNQVVFEVAVESTKAEVKSAVEGIYGVKVASVKTVNVLGKPKRGAQGVGFRANYKKAYVRLADGQTLDVVEGL